MKRSSPAGPLAPPPAALLVGLTLALAACGPSKAEQCNAFVGKAKAGMDRVKEVPSDKPEEFESAAASFDKLREELAAIALKDAKLAEYRTKYCEGLAEASKHLREDAAIHKRAKEDPKSYETHVQKLKELNQKREESRKTEDALVQEINGYCAR
jgi:hypothetical protein